MDNIQFWILIGIWMVTIVIAFIIEIETLEPIGGGLFVGAIIAVILHAIIGRSDYWWIQLLVFIVVWAAFWFLMIKLGLETKSNLKDEFIGKTVEATKGNEDEFGEVSFNDKVFRFRSEDKIAAGDSVEVQKLVGVTMVVTKKTVDKNLGGLKPAKEKGDK